MQVREIVHGGLTYKVQVAEGEVEAKAETPENKARTPANKSGRPRRKKAGDDVPADSED